MGLTQVYYSGQTVILRLNMILVDIDLLEEEKVITLCKTFYKQHKLNCRIYKTKNGYRILLTNRIFNFKKDKTFLYEVYNFFNGDERYLDMLYTKELSHYRFHARIVPKNENFASFNEEKIKKHFLIYQKDNSVAVTRYITSIGDGLILDDFKDTIIKHDKVTKAFLKDSILV
jgi:hypothetical protein